MNGYFYRQRPVYYQAPTQGYYLDPAAIPPRPQGWPPQIPWPPYIIYASPSQNWQSYQQYQQYQHQPYR
ncbi:hypothetical protein CN671_24670 [Bacillus toyonensis]|nr:hypothetical protein CN671_24670 [Bacillus toyonensis]